jgi:hypothetical protein
VSRPVGAVGIIWVYIGIIVRNDGALRAGKKLYIYLCGLCVARDKEREHLIGRLNESPVIPLSRHPMFIPIIVMEWLCGLAKDDAKDATDHAITPLWDVGIFGSHLMTLEVQDPEKKAVESLRAFHHAIASSTRLGNLLSAMGILISWCKDFEGNNEQTAEQQKHFTDVAVIIHDRLVCLRGSLGAYERSMTTAQSHLQIYRQWVSALLKSHLVNVA